MCLSDSIKIHRFNIKNSPWEGGKTLPTPLPVGAFGTSTFTFYQFILQIGAHVQNSPFSQFYYYYIQ